MTINKLCMTCFRKYFGTDAKVGTFTWGAQCHVCHTPTPRRGLLIKADVTATVMAEKASELEEETPV